MKTLAFRVSVEEPRRIHRDMTDISADRFRRNIVTQHPRHQFTYIPDTDPFGIRMKLQGLTQVFSCPTLTGKPGITADKAAGQTNVGTLAPLPEDLPQWSQFKRLHSNGPTGQQEGLQSWSVRYPEHRTRRCDSPADAGACRTYAAPCLLNWPPARRATHRRLQ